MSSVQTGMPQTLMSCNVKHTPVVSVFSSANKQGRDVFKMFPSETDNFSSHSFILFFLIDIFYFFFQVKL